MDPSSRPAEPATGRAPGGEEPPAAASAMVPVGQHPVAPIAMPPSRRHPAVLLVWLVVVLAVGSGAWLLYGRPPEVTLITPTTGPAIEAVYATGIVEAVDSSRVGTPVAGRIVQVLVREGDSVRRGDLLALVDDQAARQGLEDARARLALAEQEFARDQALVGTGAQTIQAMQRSLAERDRAQAGVAMAARQWADHRIIAPFDGIVMRRDVDPGNAAAANAGLFTVASTAHLRIAADVDERDIAAVRMGADVAISADGYPGEAFAATVTNIIRQGDAATRTFRVEADLPADTKLFIGMTVDVNIVVAKNPVALLLPPSAIRHDPPQGGHPGAAFVFTAPDGFARRVPVELGAEGPTAVEVRTGLRQGEPVIADPPASLAGGTRVRRRS